MNKRLCQLFVDLGQEQRMVLLRMVSAGCLWLDCWGTSCTAFPSWAEGVPAASLAPVCAALVGKGLIMALDLDLGLYRPTILGVQVVAAWLRFFVAYPPTGVCADE